MGPPDRISCIRTPCRAPPGRAARAVAVSGCRAVDLGRRRLVPVQDVQLGAVAAAPIPALQGRHPSPSPSPCRRTRPCPSSAPPPGRTGSAWPGRSARRAPRQRPAAGPHQLAASRLGRGGRDGLAVPELGTATRPHRQRLAWPIGATGAEAPASSRAAPGGSVEARPKGSRRPRRARDRHPLPGRTSPPRCCRSTLSTPAPTQPMREEVPETMGAPSDAGSLRLLIVAHTGPIPARSAISRKPRRGHALQRMFRPRSARETTPPSKTSGPSGPSGPTPIFPI
jgi:hypothetical protein